MRGTDLRWDEFMKFVFCRKGEEWSLDPKPSETQDWWRDWPAWVSTMLPGFNLMVFIKKKKKKEGKKENEECKT